MGSFDNAHAILGDVRQGLNEYSLELTNGSHTHGKYTNQWLFSQCINRAQARIHAALSRRLPGHFIKKVEITGVNSVFALPWDFGALSELRNSDGIKVIQVDHRSEPSSGAEGSSSFYYRQGNTLVTPKSGISETWTLWYRTKPRDVHSGACGAAGAGTTTFGTLAKGIADYYNGMTVENVTLPHYAEVTGYTAAKVATVSGTFTESTHYYGLVSELPEPFHRLIAPLAVMIAKDTHPASQERTTRPEVEQWADDLVEAIRAYTGQFDIATEEIWTDFSPAPSGGVNIPGQGYTIL